MLHKFICKHLQAHCLIFLAIWIYELMMWNVYNVCKKKIKENCKVLLNKIVEYY